MDKCFIHWWRWTAKLNDRCAVRPELLFRDVFYSLCPSRFLEDTELTTFTSSPVFITISGVALSWWEIPKRWVMLSSPFLYTVDALHRSAADTVHHPGTHRLLLLCPTICFCNQSTQMTHGLQLMSTFLSKQCLMVITGSLPGGPAGLTGQGLLPFGAPGRSGCQLHWGNPTILIRSSSDKHYWRSQLPRNKTTLFSMGLPAFLFATVVATHTGKLLFSWMGLSWGQQIWGFLLCHVSI